MELREKKTGKELFTKNKIIALNNLRNFLDCNFPSTWYKITVSATQICKPQKGFSRFHCKFAVLFCQTHAPKVIVKNRHSSINLKIDGSRNLSVLLYKVN